MIFLWWRIFRKPPVRISFQDFHQKKFEHQSKNTAIFQKPFLKNCGEGGIRTHDTLADMTVFPPEADPSFGGQDLPYSAEAVRFELTVPCETPVFKTGALNHYATPPRQKQG